MAASDRNFPKKVSWMTPSQKNRSNHESRNNYENCENRENSANRKEKKNACDRSGYDTDIFVHRVPGDLHCAICLNVARKAMVFPEPCDCSLLYCKGCIERLDPIKCPSCHQYFPKNNLVPQRFIDNKITRMIIKCKHFKVGCNESFVMGKDERNLMRHLQEECGYQYISCQDCGKEVLGHEFEWHLSNICPQRVTQFQVACEFCGDKVKSNFLKNHNEQNIQRHLDEMLKMITNQQKRIMCLEQDHGRFKSKICNMEGKVSRIVGQSKDKFPKFDKIIGPGTITETTFSYSMESPKHCLAMWSKRYFPHTGLYRWNVRIQRCLPGVETFHISIGICRPSLDRPCLLGKGGDWGYCNQGCILHNSCDSSHKYATPYGKGDVIKVELDTDKGTLSFYRNTDFLGVAYEGITKPVCAAVSIGWTHRKKAVVEFV